MLLRKWRSCHFAPKNIIFFVYLGNILFICFRKMPEKEKKKPVLDKIVIDTMPPKSGTCVYHNFLYALLGLGGALYLAFILDRESFDKYSKQYSYLGRKFKV